MASPEQVEIIRKSIDKWNRWRKAHQEVQPDLQGADLRKEGFYRADLRGANLAKADLSGAHFYEAHLGGADLRGATLVRANLCRSYLREANLEGANLEWANLQECLLNGANLTGARFTGAFLRDAEMDDVHGLDDKTRLVWEIMNQGAEGQDLRGVDLSGSFLHKANLQGADLGGANLQGAILSNANLAGANLIGANLEDANFRDANLQGTHLEGMKLEKDMLEEAPPTLPPKVVCITIEDGLEVSGTVRTAAYVCQLYCSFPASWLFRGGLRAYARERVLEQHYGVNWKAGNEDGSRYVIRRFEVEVIGSTEELERARRGVDKRDAGVRYWFYLADQQGRLEKVDPETFFEASGPHCVKQVSALSGEEDPADQQWRALIAQYGPPQSLSALTLEEQQEAVQERRVLGMRCIRDGFGGGTVGCWLVELKDLDAKASRDPSCYTAYFVFSPPCTLTAEVVRQLNRNGWENLHELLYL